MTPVAGLMTSEAGDKASFTIRLDSRPTANVVIGLSSSMLTEGTVAPASLTFSPLNWDSAQTVNVTGVDDAVADGNTAYFIITAAALSADPNYSGRNAADVSVTNSDNDQANILVSGASALVTSESGATVTFNLMLTTAPVAAVTIPLRSSNLSEGSVNPAQVTFTSQTWNLPQTVTVTGIDDTLLDGDIVYTIITGPAISTDAKYSALDTTDVQVLNRDNDTASILLTAATGLVTTEARGIAQFTVALSHPPSAAVSIFLASSNENEGTVAPQTLMFTSANWNKEQTVTITGVDDTVDDGDVAYKISIDPSASQDNNFRVLMLLSLDIINRDDDGPPATQNDSGDGLIIAAKPNLTTTESGGTAAFTIQLAHAPDAQVKISLRSSNTKEGVVRPSSLIFEPSDWNRPQTVTVTGVDDSNLDGNVAYQVQISAPSSNDMTFASTQPREITVVNADNEEKVATGAWSPLFLFLLYGIATRREWLHHRLFAA